jgi:alcohol dehydrogenase YqhD (iron-dependent ADH family)
VLYDVPHGASLSVVYPAWLKLQKDRIPERIAELGLNLFGKSGPDEAIAGLESFFSSLDSPVRLRDININVSEKRKEIYEGLIIGEAGGSHHKLSKEDYHELIDLMA